MRPDSDAPSPVSRWGPVVAYCGLIFFLSAQSRFDFAPPGLWSFDKVIHMAEYGVLAALLLRATQKARLSLLIAGLYGVSDEVHQYFVPGRSASPYDAIADVVGAGIVCGLWYFKSKRGQRT